MADKLEGDNKALFLKAVEKQINRTATALGKRLDDEDLGTIASALLIRLEGDGWSINAPVPES